MTFQMAIETCFRRYFDFTGRSGRSEFWFFTLFVLISSVMLIYADARPLP